MCVVGDGTPVTHLRGECCNKFVDENSMFFAENAGVCYTANFDLTPSRAVRTSSVRMWMAVNKENAMKQSFFLLGDKVMERFSPVFTITFWPDTPPGAINQSPKKSSLDTISTMALRKQLMDRSRLNDDGILISTSSDDCATQEEEEQFSAKYGLSYTQDNCRLMINHFTTGKHCSMASLLGIPQMKDSSPLPACQPRDTVALAKVINDSQSETLKITRERLGQELICKKECLKSNLVATVSWGKGNFDPLKDMLKAIGEKPYQGDFDDLHFSGIEIFYDSFEFSHVKLYREGLDVFLSRVGGWLGLALGASLLSLLEVSIFAFQFVKIMLNKKIFH